MRTATAIGVSDAEFWAMLPREFERKVEEFRERKKQEAEREKMRFYNMLNAFGSVMGGSKWKWQKPSSAPPEDFEDRERRALQRHHARRKRKHGVQSRK